MAGACRTQRRDEKYKDHFASNIFFFFFFFFFFFLYGTPAHIGPWPPLYEVP
jgi:hypothetical protein